MTLKPAFGAASWIFMALALCLFTGTGPPEARDRTAIGGNLSATGNVDGDINYMGGTIEVDADVTGSVNAFGGDIEVRGRVGGDVNLFGGDVEIGANVEGDLNVAGGTIEVLPGASVSGNAHIAGGSITMNGTIERDLEVAGGRVVIGGVVRGDIEAHAEEFEILEGAQVTGMVTLRGPKEPVIATDTVSGGIDYEYEDRWFRRWDGPVMEWHFGKGAAIAGLLVMGVWALLSGVILILAFPRFTGHAGHAQKEGILSSLGLGLVTLIAVPILGVFLVATLLALPVGFFLLGIYGFLFYFGYITGVIGASRLAMRGSDVLPSRGTQIIWFAGAVVIATAIGLIPFAGFAISLLLTISGVGGIMIALFTRPPG